MLHYCTTALISALALLNYSASGACTRHCTAKM